MQALREIYSLICQLHGAFLESALQIKEFSILAVIYVICVKWGVSLPGIRHFILAFAEEANAPFVESPVTKVYIRSIDNRLGLYKLLLLPTMFFMTLLAAFVGSLYGHYAVIALLPGIKTSANCYTIFFSLASISALTFFLGFHFFKSTLRVAEFICEQQAQGCT